MGTFYLVDFENVHNDNINGINTLSKNDHVHIFTTENSPYIQCEIAFSKKAEIKGHIVPAGKQSLDMHLISYLGLLMGTFGKSASYVIVSNDTDYDNIIEFWKEEGYHNISRKCKIPGSQIKVSNKAVQSVPPPQNPVRQLSGEEKSKLNIFIQHELRKIGYDSATSNKVCSIVISHCNKKDTNTAVLRELITLYKGNELICKDVIKLLDSYFGTDANNKQSKPISEKEKQIRSFFDQHFKKQIYTQHKKEIISIILNSKTKSEINNNLQKIYSDNNVVKHINKQIHPLIKTLLGK